MMGGEGHPFPSRLSFVLDTPLRRRLHPPSGVIKALGVKQVMLFWILAAAPGSTRYPLQRLPRRPSRSTESEMLEKVSRNAERVGLSVQCFQSDGLKIPYQTNTAIWLFSAESTMQNVRVSRW